MLRLFCLIIISGLIVGCSNNVPLKGTVTFSDDGSPLTEGTVGFQKDGRVARGTIREDGTYIVGFEKEGDGLPPGKYQVFLSGTDKVTMTLISKEGEIEAFDYKYEPLIDKKYGRPETSELTIDVNSSTKTFDIQVERFKRR
jgi:hypothetical protein